jgi:hypothetical protein
MSFFVNAVAERDFFKSLSQIPRRGEGRENVGT